MTSKKADPEGEVKLVPIHEAPVYLPQARSLFRELCKWAPFSFGACISNGEIDTMLSDGYWLFVTVEKEIVGLVGIHGISHLDRTAKVSVIIHPDARRLGIGRKAGLALREWMVRSTQIRKVIGFCLASNHVIGKLLTEDGGFVQEGLLKEARFLDGRYVDVVIYSLLITEELREQVLKGE